VVETDPVQRGILIGALRDAGFRVWYADSPEDVLEHVTEQNIDLVVCNDSLGKLDGLAVVREVHKRQPETAVVLMTSNHDQAHTRAAIEAGAADILPKPFDPRSLIIAANSAIAYHQTGRRRAEEFDALVKTKSVEVLVAAVEAKERLTGVHSRRVARIAGEIGRYIGLGREEVRQIELGALVHDVGKIGMPDSLLAKNGPLSAEEWAVMRTHPEIGEEIVRRVPELSSVALMVRHHHERVDGTGYPDRLAGDAIPLHARIISIADAWECMTSDRPYRARLKRDEAMSRLVEGCGSQFDTAIVQAFIVMDTGDDYQP
jgi:putative two-component system response regulator